MNKSLIEFYLDNVIIASIAYTSIVPHEGSAISIRGKSYRVMSVSYALDHADLYDQKIMRANVELQRLGW